MKTQAHQLFLWVAVAALTGPPGANAQFTANTKLGSGLAGSIVTNAAGSYSVLAGGQDIFGGGDEFTFHNFGFQGVFFDLRVRVQSLEPNAPLTRAGLMVRESNATNSRMAFVRVTPSGPTLNGGTGANDVRFQYRLGSATPAQGEHEDPAAGFPRPVYPNAWVRLERHGSIIGGYSSIDGTNWLLLANQDTAAWPNGAFQPAFFLGLAQSRHPAGAKPTNSVEYRNYTSAGNFPPLISDIPNGIINEDGSTGALPFQIGDFETAAASLVVSATSSNPTLFPAGSLALAGTGTNRTITCTPAGNQNGIAVITVTVSDGVRTANDRFQVTVAPVNDPPTISGLQNVSIPEDTPTAPLPFVIGDPDSALSTLTLSGFADNATLVPSANIVFGGTGANRTVTVTPAPNLFGTARITLRVSDGSLSNSTVFSLTVLPVNDPPTISPINDQTINANSSTGPLAFSIGDAETPAASLGLFASSSNPTLVPANNILFGGAGTNRTVTVTPVLDGFGIADITVNVTDGTNTTQEGFRVTVNPLPVTLVNPPQDQTVDEGGKATFSVTASGTPPLRFQWSFNGQPISGATDNSYTIPSAHPADAGPYAVAVSNPAGTVTGSAVLTVVQLDYGDAPDRPYPTLLGSDGARHRIAPDMFLGARIDGETNGQPNVTATGDDAIPTTADDEDGVLFLTALVPGQAAAIQVVASKPGRLDAWIDFEGNGSWADAGNRIFSSRTLAAGTNTLAFTVPAAAKVGATYARFRYSSQGDLNFIGLAQDGEVEDYLVNIVDRALDLGDAPASYHTLLADNGPSHGILAGFHLGAAIDSEPDGQPSADALGDDKPSPAGIDDEDGVTFLSPIVPGQPAQIEVVASGSGRLDAWLDFNGNGTFDDPGEQIFTGQALATGVNALVFNVPTAAAARQTFARFRLSREGGLKFDGPAPDGEVEDYQVAIESRFLDFGDAPQNYPVVLAQNGARHAQSEIHLGTFIDLEPDGQPSGDALGDDNTVGSIDDEDGVKFLTPIVPGQTAQIEVTVNLSCFLDAWIDWNFNGSWADAGDRIFTAQPVSAGANVLSVPVPATASSRVTFARFRVSSKGGLDFTGFAPDGEVEDYRVDVEPRQLDFGDAPENYPVLLANNGARHLIVPGFHLGERVDAEPNGQPSGDALGDDNNPSTADDEDGVRFLTPLVPGQTAQVEVTASAEGLLNAWVDFNINGSWADANEQIFTDVPLAPGPNTLAFVVPSSAVPRATYARFRFSREGKLSFDGIAPDGEVEDYRVEQGRPRECDQDCSGTNFWLAFPGNYAPDTNNPVRLTLCLIGSGGTPGEVSVPGLGFSAPFILPASGTLLLAVPRQADLGDANDVITKKGIHVTAAGPISVQALNHVRYTSDGYLGFPTSALGMEYLVDSFANTHIGAPDLNGSQFAIAACEDNTRVRIIPRIAVGAHPANTPFIIVLQAGETYQLRATNDSPADLTGTVIESDHPVAVFGSHQCANIPSGNQWFCDYIVEQLMPTKAWGRGFVTAPLETRAGDTFRILAATDDTDVFVGGALVANLNRGEFHQLTMPTGAVIIASSPVSVMQYANSSDYDLVTDADPFMVIVPPANKFNSSHVVCTAPTDFTAHYLNIIAPAAGVGAVSVDGAVVPAASFVPIGASAFLYAQVPVTTGRHAVSSPVPVGVTVYGWGEYDSYGYTGCIAFGDTTPPTVTCRVTNVTVTLGTPGTVPNCTAEVPDLRGQVQVSDNCGLSPNSVPRQTPAPGTAVGPGVHPITITVFDAEGNSASCVITFTVIDPNPPILSCPTNVVARCSNPSGGIARFVVTARTLCSSNLPVQCTPPSGTFLPPGVTAVTCVASNGGQTVTCVFPVTVVCEKLSVQVINGNTVLVYDGGTLESATSITGPWQAVPNARSPYLLPTDRITRFYRLRFDEP